MTVFTYSFAWAAHEVIAVNSDAIKKIDKEIEEIKKKESIPKQVNDTPENCPVDNLDKRRQKKCRYNNGGYCKYESKCRFIHPENCKNHLNDKKCEDNNCPFRHHKMCK